MEQQSDPPSPPEPEAPPPPKKGPHARVRATLTIMRHEPGKEPTYERTIVWADAAVKIVEEQNEGDRAIQAYIVGEPQADPWTAPIQGGVN